MGLRIRRNLYIKKLKVRKNRILCVILHEGKGSSWVLVDENAERFSVGGNTYFKVDDGTYIRGVGRFMVYMEGISTPIHHGYIEKEMVFKTILDKETGEKKDYKLYKIKGLKYDSKIIDILLNRHLADEFTRQHLDLPNLVIIVLLIVTVLLGIANIVIPFFVKGG